MDRQADHSVEGLQLVGLHRCLVLVQVRERVLCAIMMRIVVRIDGLCLETCDGIKFLCTNVIVVDILDNMTFLNVLTVFSFVSGLLVE